MKKIYTVTAFLHFGLETRGEGYRLCHTAVFENRKAAELHARDIEACYENALEYAREQFDDDVVLNPHIGEIAIQTVDLW